MEEANVNNDIKIFIAKCRGLQSSKASGQFLVSTKAEFGNTLLGESGKVELNQETGFFVFDFAFSLNISVADPVILDEIAQTPIVVTFSEILPKDKKAKEEKTNTLGQCCIDLLPLLRGDGSFSVIEPIHLLSGNENAKDDAMGEVHLTVSTDKPLLSEEQLENCNLLTVCVESAYSLPESWNTNGSSFMYTACLPMPLNHEKETPVILPNGTFKTSGEKELSGQRKWSCAPSASGSCLYIPNTEIHHRAYEDEDGDLCKKQDFEFRQNAESHKPRVTWNVERRCFMSQTASHCFQQRIAQYRRWPLEIIRISQGNVGQKGKGKEDECITSFHGVAYVDLAPLLYPGVSKIHGAYLLHPYNELELMEKFNHKTTLTDDVIKNLTGVNRTSSPMGASKGGAKPAKVDAKTKSIVNLKHESETEQPGHVMCHEAQEYIDSKSYVVLEIELEKPLVQKRQLAEVKSKISELIPPRPAFVKKQGGSEKVIKDFQDQIGQMANVIMEEFRKIFPDLKSTQDADEVEERRKTFFYHLNTSGKYCALKEQIKYFVIKIVREKFLYTQSFKSNEEIQSFSTSLYMFLLDHMHHGLNKYLTTEETAEVPPAVHDVHVLKQFAQEAQDMFNFKQADKYYQERLLRNKNNPDCHVDYGIFCLLIGDIQRAEQCFKDAVSIDQEHLEGLLLSGMTCFMNEEFENGEELLDAITYLYPNDPLPWTVFGLHYSAVENVIMSERCFSKAVEAQKPIDGDEEKGKSIYIEATKFLLQCNMLQMSERALAHELIEEQKQESVEYLLFLSELYTKRKQYDKALEKVEVAIVKQHQNSIAWSLKGHIYFHLNNMDEAASCYERCLAYITPPSDLHRVYTRLASIYLKNKDFVKAKETHLYLCEHFPSCHTWLGLGIACFRLDELNEAEHCLNEANTYDNLNADVWSYLTLVCLKKKKNCQAEQCYKYSLKLGIDESLRDELTSKIATIAI